MLNAPEKLFLALGVSLLFSYLSLAGNIFDKGYYSPKDAKNKLSKRANTSSNKATSKDVSKEEQKNQKLITVVTYYDEPDFGLTIIREEEKGVVYQKKPRRRTYHLKATTSSRSYKRRCDKDGVVYIER